MLKGRPPDSNSDEVNLARSIAAKVKDLREIRCPYCRNKGEAGIDPGEDILGGKTRPGLCRSCDLHGVVWRMRDQLKTHTAAEVIDRWGPTLET